MHTGPSPPAQKLAGIVLHTGFKRKIIWQNKKLKEFKALIGHWPLVPPGWQSWHLLAYQLSVQDG
jgi:hypothetical protein